MRIVVLLTCVTLVAGAWGGATPRAGGPDRTAAPATTAATPLCGAATTAAVAHVILIMMENTSAARANALPYVTRLRHHCGVATDYHAVTHPSLGNYIALTSGAIPRAIRGSDCSPSATCHSRHLSIFGQLAGRWRVYAQSTPSPCYTGTTSLYAVRHTAAPYYPAIRPACTRQQVRLRNLRHALAAGPLPRFSLVVPNVVDDMHNGCASCGNAFLKTWIRRIHQAPQYQDGSTVVFVTW